jgi:hypothetical protein
MMNRKCRRPLYKVEWRTIAYAGGTKTDVTRSSHSQGIGPPRRRASSETTTTAAQAPTKHRIVSSGSCTAK